MEQHDDNKNTEESQVNVIEVDNQSNGIHYNISSQRISFGIDLFPACPALVTAARFISLPAAPDA